MTCATYIVPPGFQITQGGVTGPVDCSAWAGGRACGHATCGAKVPSGRSIRLQSDEPIPDPASPGLNLVQVDRVLTNRYGVNLDVHISTMSVTRAEYEKRRLAGQGCIIQVGYGPIADSKYDAGGGFRGNHAIFESLHATYDPLADGRRAGIWKFDGTVYPRDLIFDAASKLVISKTGQKAGTDHVWAAFTRDVVPDYKVVIPAGAYLAYNVVGGVVQYRRKREALNTITQRCTPPKGYHWGDRTVYLVRITAGKYIGRYVSARYSKEMVP